MLREKMNQSGLIGDADFRWRGGDVSRIEALSDAVFAIAIALLVVSLEVPRTFEELMGIMHGFVAFAVTLTAIVAIWYVHYIYFRRFGFEDGITIMLNTALLFVVLFYIYPLKFLATLLITYLLLNRGLGLDVVVDISMQNAQWPTLMIVYSSGFVAVFLIFMLLYLHAWRRREALELNEIEQVLTRGSIFGYGIMVAIGLASILIAAIAGPHGSLWAGLIYWLTGPLSAIYGVRIRRKVLVLKAGKA